MCGIIGFNWENAKLVKELAGLLNHRGPEQQGYHIGDGVSIGHKRLCILDLSAKGTQPLYNEDKSVCISFNGEIYNFEALREELKKFGHVFTSRTDTEVLIHGYEQWGTELLRKINGEFAFCIFDKNKKIFFIARDRLGIRPLYYYDKAQKFIFGSELKVFLKSDIDKQIDQRALDHYMLFGNTPAEQSILQNVKKLLPGFYLIYDLTAKQIKETSCFWDVSFQENKDITEAQAITQLTQRLEKSVKLRLISDVPVGAFLSGGVDSSIIVSIMRKYITDLNTFSIKFDYPDFNESQYARIVSDLFGTKHHEISFNAENVKELIPQLPYYYDEPFGDSSMIPTSLVCRVAKQNVTVALSGTGGDELFGGYRSYIDFYRVLKLLTLPLPIRRALDVFIRIFNKPLSNDRLNKLSVFLGSVTEQHQAYLMAFSYMFRHKSESKDKLLQFDYLKKHFKYDSPLINAMNFDVKEYLPNCLLVKEDRAAMAVSLEARIPFLDHEFVEFAASLPLKFKIKGSQQKYLLKKAYSDVLPEQILNRKKQGFGVPLIHYFRNELKDYAYNEIFGFKEIDYLDKDFLRNAWQRHQAEKSDYSRLLWSVMMFNMWFKRWMA
ncbi:MAG: asparagine synthase (glutamine-hydrolyzing) [Phycisphaerae bacterium]